MALDKLTEDYLLSLLNEAPQQDPNAGGTNMETSNDNATYEPQEQDASMGTETDMGEGNMDAGMEEMDMDMGEGGGEGDPNAGMGGDASMGGGSAPANAKDIFKKRKLFIDYKELLSVMEDLMDVTSNMLSKELPRDAKKVYTFVNRKMEENRQKVLIILTEQYFNLSYQQLLSLFMYIKIAVKSYSDIIKQINDLYYKED